MRTCLLNFPKPSAAEDGSQTMVGLRILLVTREVLPGGTRSTFLGLLEIKQNAVTVNESKGFSCQRRKHCFTIRNYI